MNERSALPNRRLCETFSFKVNGARYHGSVGYYDDGRIGEVFLNCAKPGTDVQVAMRDSAIALSMALQYGTPIETFKKALCRLDDRAPEGPLGRFLDLLEKAG